MALSPKLICKTPSSQPYDADEEKERNRSELCKERRQKRYKATHLNDRTNSNLEFKGLPTVMATIKLLSIGGQGACVAKNET
jgi:hypothetical protein